MAKEHLTPPFGWNTDRTVEEWLYEEPYRFDFFQAVRILELLNPAAVSAGQGSDPEREAVRFRARVGLDFPASEIHEVWGPSVEAYRNAGLRPDEPRLTPSPQLWEGYTGMTVNFLGLAGAFGPLPHADTELLMERIRARDYTMRDFLDIFNHRLISLMYQVRKLHRVALTTQSPERTPVARYLFSLFGLGLEQSADNPGPLRGRMQVDDQSLLYLAGILSQQPRSAAGLERLLSRHFGVGVEVLQLVGRWRDLGRDQWTRIGIGGQHRRLGRSVALGTRIWDQQGAFEVRLGTFSLTQFLDFLPGGTAWKPLCELTRFYSGLQFEFAFRLTLKAAEVPQLRLGKSRLGWTSWLKVREFRADDSQACIRVA